MSDTQDKKTIMMRLKERVHSEHCKLEIETNSIEVQTIFPYDYEQNCSNPLPKPLHRIVLNTFKHESLKSEDSFNLKQSISSKYKYYSPNNRIGNLKSITPVTFFPDFGKRGLDYGSRKVSVKLRRPPCGKLFVSSPKRNNIHRIRLRTQCKSYVSLVPAISFKFNELPSLY